MKQITLALLATLPVLGLLTPIQAGDVAPVRAVNLEKLNTDADEDDPFVAADGLTLYYASNVGGTYGIRVSKRVLANQQWPAGKPLLVSKDFDHRSPFVYKNELYYAANEVPDATLADLKNFDIFRKVDTLAPVPLLGIGEKTDELHPWITPAGKEFYFSRKTEEGWKLLVANGPVPGPIGKAKPVGFEPGFHHATLSKSTLQMYLQGPLDGGRWGIFHSRREKVGAAWSKPEPVPGLNNAEGKQGDLSPCLSADGSKLYFASDRPGGKGGLDIWYVMTNQLK